MKSNNTQISHLVKLTLVAFNESNVIINLIIPDYFTPVNARSRTDAFQKDTELFREYVIGNVNI